MSYTAKDIVVLDGISHVRQVPALYIKDTSKDGLHHLFLEILDNSLTWDMPILVKENNIIKNIYIGELIDKYIPKDTDKDISIRSGFDVECLSFDKDNKIKWNKVSSLIRHKKNSDILSIKLQNNRIINITPYHSLFSNINGEIKAIKGSDISVGTPILCPKYYPESNSSLKYGDKLDIFQLLYELDKSDTDKLIFTKLPDLLSNDILSKHVKEYIKLSGKKISIHDYKYYDYLPFNCWRTLPDNIKEMFYDSKIRNNKGDYCLNRYLNIDSDLIDLLGIYTAEGNITQSGYNHRISFSFGSHEIELINHIKNLIHRIFGYCIDIQKQHKTANCIHINSVLVYILFSKIFKLGNNCYKKRIPEIIWNSDRKIRERYLIACCSGDGCPTKSFINNLTNNIPLDLKQKYSYCSSSKMMISDLTYLLYTLNKTFSYRENKAYDHILNNNIVHSYISYAIDFYWNSKQSYINRKNENNEILSDSDLGFLKVKSINKCDYDKEWVYDVSVPGGENFVAGISPICAHNSSDEISAGFGKRISVFLHKDGSIEVQDEGRGIPCELHPKEGIPTLDVVLTKLNAGGKFSKSGYATASSLAGLHGVGSSVVNALSEWMKAYVKRDGKEYSREYSRGQVIGDPQKLSEKKIKDASTGTKIIFKPDSQIFKTLKFDEHTIIHRLKELSYLFKGITFEFTNLRDDKQTESFMSQNGISDYLDVICEDKDGVFPDKPIVFEGKAGNTVAEIAIKYSSDLGETCISFCNGIHTIDQGTHVSGFRKAFTRALNAHGKEFKIIPEKEENLSGDDLRDGMNCIIAVKVKEPQFAGQSKAKLNNPEVESEVGEIIFSQAVDYLKNNQPLAKKILEAALATRRARQAAKKQTELMRRKSVFGKTTLPGKLIDCASEKQEETELFIVEGLSAVGTARDARDAKYQALLPLKGKIISSEKQTLEKVLENQEIQDILSSIGLPIEQFGTDNINLAKLRYGKIIFMFDADEDGSHIATLSMAMFLKYMRPLIENGMVYIVQAPLYTVKTSDKKVYCYNKQEMEKAMAKMPKAQVVRMKGLGEANSKELAETCMEPKTRRIYQIDLPDLAEANKMVKVFMGTNTVDRKKILFGEK